jgi:hypothetical protein
LTLRLRGLKEGKKTPRESALLPYPGIQIFWNGDEFGKNAASLSKQFAASANRQFEFEKRSQLFIRPHNETLSVVTMCVSNPDRSPVGIKS